MSVILEFSFKHDRAFVSGLIFVSLLRFNSREEHKTLWLLKEILLKI